MNKNNMKKNENKALLKRFGIVIPDRLDDVNLIGFDYGDGDIVAYTVCWNGVTRKMEVNHLYFGPQWTSPKLPNIFYMRSDDSEFDSVVTEIEERSEEAGNIYYNFKRCPGSQEASCKYVPDDGKKKEDALTYEEIMERGFHVFVKRLFEYNSCLSRKKPTIILVGRPSSEAWAKSEKEYAKMLERNLKIPGYDMPVKVAVESESLAAMAREINPEKDGTYVSRDVMKVMVILDCGSSTFDITVVTESGIPEGGQDSFQFGGNVLDKILEAAMKEKFEKEYPGAVLKNKHGHKVGLRFCKENYYGQEGKNMKSQIYSVEFFYPEDLEAGKMLPQIYDMKLDRVMMKQVLNQRPVEVHHLEAEFGPVITMDTQKYDSWMLACEGIFTAFYEKMKEFFQNLHPDKLILTGGLSVMPEVRTAAEKCFGVEPVISTKPNYSVAEGLAYVLGTEVRKKQHLNELKDIILEVLSVSPEELRQNMTAECADFIWNPIEESLKEWKEASEDTTMIDWLNSYYVPCHKVKAANYRKVPIRQGVMNWYNDNNIDQEIEKALEKDFRKMFPDYASHFTLNWSGKELLQFLQGEDWEIKVGECLPLLLKPEVYDALGKTCFQEERQQIYQYAAEHKSLFMEGKDTYRVDKRGLKAVLGDEINMSFTEKIRSEIIEILNEELEIYADSITPYFIMTASTASY